MDPRQRPIRLLTSAATVWLGAATVKRSPFLCRWSRSGCSRRNGRLTRAALLRRVQETGKRRRLPHLDVLWTDNQAGHPRVGLIVPKFQSTAVARNRLRRWLREVWRRQLVAAVPPWDVVIRARREAYGSGFAALQSELVAWRLSLG